MIQSLSPIDGRHIGDAAAASEAELDAAPARAAAAFLSWRDVPAPRRGALVRLWGEALRRRKSQLAAMVTLEAGKIVSEAEGEVQEMIDMADFAVGLSRQLSGLALPSERPGHQLIERWKPLGPVAIITAFNFPVAVFAWNAALALICGNPVIWKPSEKTPLCAALAMESLEEAIAAFGPDAPAGLAILVQGGAEAGRKLAADPRVRLVSATGSTAMGRQVQAVAGLRRTLLELGGNGAMIVRPSADLDLAVRAALFAAYGTAGQRCTSLRRLILHPAVAAEFLTRFESAARSMAIGDPRDPRVLVGPLIDADALARLDTALERARAEGGRVRFGGARIRPPGLDGGCYVQPALTMMPEQTAIVREETFAPLVHALVAEDLDAAIALNNGVPQGLSSCIFTRDQREAGRFLAEAGSDCGIANVNAGTSGAEIGGAFGGEKDTGGGREAGSDAWKAYMFRQTQTLNHSDALPLAQGVRFDL